MTISHMDHRDWDRVVDEIGPRLYRYFKYKGTNDLASDLTQETFIRLMGNIHKFNPSTGPLIAFALGVAQNIWRENLRRQSPSVSFDEQTDLASAFDLHEQVEKLDQAEKLRLIVGRLPQVQQDVLYFYFDEEITTREIGEVLGMPEGTVKSHLHRAKDSIRFILEKEWL